MFKFLNVVSAMILTMGVALILPNESWGSEEAYRIPPTDQHHISSKFVDQTYQIEVSMPISQEGGKERFPVLYVTDGNIWADSLSVMANLMQAGGALERFILVRIGYPSDSLFAGGRLRTRDLVPPQGRIYFDEGRAALRAKSDGKTAPSKSLFESGVIPYTKGESATSAKEFVQFIQKELIPYIDERYPTRADDNNYFGHSAGGSFGLYVLFSQPELFKRYILGSPAIGFNGRFFGLEQAEQYVASGKDLQAKVYLAYGNEGHDLDLALFDIAGGYYALSRLLKGAAIPGLELTFKEFPNETHNTAWMPIYVHGVKALFGKADCLPWMLPNTCP